MGTPRRQQQERAEAAPEDVASGRLNPYRPPPTLAPPTDAEVKAELFARPVRFAGSVTATELRSILGDRGSVGCPTTALAFFFAGLLVLWATMVGAAAGAMIAGGMAALLGLALVVSSSLYRLKIMTAANPHWASAISGSIDQSGFLIHRGPESTLYRWEWFGSVTVTREVIGLIPVLRPDAMLVLTRAMFSEPDWDSFRRFLDLELLHPRSWTGLSGRAAVAESRLRHRGGVGGQGSASAETLLERLRDDPRVSPSAIEALTGNPEAKAVRLSGELRFGDAAAARASLRRRRTRRSQVVYAIMLLAFAAILHGGLAVSGWLNASIADARLIGITCGVTIGILLWRRWGAWRRSPASRRRVLYHVDAVVNEQSCLFDLGLVAALIPQSCLRATAYAPDGIDVRWQYGVSSLHLHRRMANTDEDWTRVRSLLRVS